MATSRSGLDDYPTQRGLGLMGMRERVELLGGEMEILTAPGFGTQLYFRVPLRPQDTPHG